MSDAKKITLYGADWCSDCTRSKGYLDAHQVPYTYVDVDADAAAKEMDVFLGTCESAAQLLAP